MFRDVHCNLVYSTRTLKTTRLSIRNQITKLGSHATPNDAAGLFFWTQQDTYIYQMKERKHICAAFNLPPLCHYSSWLESPSRLDLLFCMWLSILCYLITVLCPGLYVQGPCLVLAPLFPSSNRSRWLLIIAEFNWGMWTKGLVISIMWY